MEVLLDTPSWYAWLETATTFTFTCEEGTFTAHKARAGNRRGGWYWRAYRRKQGQLFRCYLGVSANLTLAKLREAACRLAAGAEGRGSHRADEGTPPLPHVPPSSQGRLPTVILQSSITPPRLPVQHVARPRLLALLERLTGPLCESVTEAGGGQQKLASLLQANLFVSALDDTDTWYRYHPLFAETLRTQMQKQEPALVPELYRRASRWYEQHGWAEDACEYAYRASDLPHTARLLEELVPSLVEQGKLVRLGHWLDRLPQEVISSSVPLSLAWIWTQPLRTSQPPDPEGVIEYLTALLKTHEKDDPAAQAALQRELMLQQATLALARGDIPQALSCAAEMTRSLTGPETAWSRFTLWRQQVLLGAVYRVRGDLLASEQTLRQALPAGGPSPNFVVIASLDELYEELGRLREL